MSMSNNEHPDDIPPGVSPSTSQPSQQWTVDGYPIVDGKFHDLAADEIKTHTGVFRGGPPSLSVYWNNCASVSRPNQFVAMGCISGHSVTEYLVRVGEMLRQGKCTVSSLNATQYAVNVIVLTYLSSEEFTGLLREHGLTASS
ncbi:hypothetical protein FALBO_210 [Fusarium albosuccineum]|uniref:Uncharacterized protein n=1 Tax=Fusarium albosuccineum TaxID=1237068 RepID=A0A8H4LRH6_9HYPO|nr:hypothetical protein FALBO_210 [Fusarium albosuccineum]